MVKKGREVDFRVISKSRLLSRMGVQIHRCWSQPGVFHLSSWGNPGKRDPSARREDCYITWHLGPAPTLAPGWAGGAQLLPPVGATSEGSAVRGRRRPGRSWAGHRGQGVSPEGRCQTAAFAGSSLPRGACSSPPLARAAASCNSQTRTGNTPRSPLPAGRRAKSIGDQNCVQPSLPFATRRQTLLI